VTAIGGQGGQALSSADLLSWDPTKGRTAGCEFAFLPGNPRQLAVAQRLDKAEVQLLHLVRFAQLAMERLFALDIDCRRRFWRQNQHPLRATPLRRRCIERERRGVRTTLLLGVLLLRRDKLRLVPSVARVMGELAVLRPVQGVLVLYVHAWWVVLVVLVLLLLLPGLVLLGLVLVVQQAPLVRIRIRIRVLLLPVPQDLLQLRLDFFQFRQGLLASHPDLYALRLDLFQLPFLLPLSTPMRLLLMQVVCPQLRRPIGGDHRPTRGLFGGWNQCAPRGSPALSDGQSSVRMRVPRDQLRR